jgi:hypothetical protein
MPEDTVDIIASFIYYNDPSPCGPVQQSAYGTLSMLALYNADLSPWAHFQSHSCPIEELKEVAARNGTVGENIISSGWYHLLFLILLLLFLHAFDFWLLIDDMTDSLI